MQMRKTNREKGYCIFIKSAALLVNKLNCGGPQFLLITRANGPGQVNSSYSKRKSCDEHYTGRSF